jgi:hypothetical protein
LPRAERPVHLLNCVFGDAKVIAAQPDEALLHEAHLEQFVEVTFFNLAGINARLLNNDTEPELLPFSKLHSKVLSNSIMLGPLLIDTRLQLLQLDHAILNLPLPLKLCLLGLYQLAKENLDADPGTINVPDTFNNTFVHDLGFT